MMQRLRRSPYALLVVIHLIIALVAFKGFWKDRSNTALCAYGDGIKNNFTLLSYVKDPLTKDGVFKYNAMNYPFGEYVYTTDNTPIFSIPFRFFCCHICDLSDHTLAFYSVFIIFNFLLCGLMLFFIFRRILRSDWLSFVMAILLPWSNIQVLRIARGHFNLSLSSLIVAAICLIILWHERKQQNKKVLGVGVLMVLLTFFGFLAHGYYLPILSCFLAFCLVFYAWYNRRERVIWQPSVVAAIAVPVLSLALSLGLLKATDGYFNLRSGHANPGQKVEFSALFSAYKFVSIPFPFHRAELNNAAEGGAYLGSIGLFAILFLGIAALLNKNIRQKLSAIHKDFFKDKLRSTLFFGGLFMLIMSFGTHYFVADNYVIENIINPFFYLEKLTDKVSQFRSLERFFFPFFFTFYLWILYVLIRFFEQSGRPSKGIIIACLVILGSVELRDYINALQKGANKPNSFGPNEMAALNKLHIPYNDYQAIIPLPFFVVGSEEGDKTIDDFPPLSDFVFQLSLRSHLPLVATKLARTAPSQANALLNFVCKDSISNEIKERINQKPFLIVVHNKVIHDSASAIIPGDAVSKENYWKSIELIHRHNLQPIDSMDDFTFYKWNAIP